MKHQVTKSLPPAEEICTIVLELTRREADALREVCCWQASVAKLIAEKHELGALPLKYPVARTLIELREALVAAGARSMD